MMTFEPRLRLSIAVTAYNRRDLLPAALDSALAFLDHLPESVRAEIVVVDDASQDDTVEVVEARYADEIAASRIRILRQPRNTGTGGAKNRAVAGASGDWVLILDSDDALIAEAAPRVLEELKKAKGALAFFRCVDYDSGELVGPATDDARDLDLERYLREGTPGECLPIVRRDSFLRFPLNPDWASCEGWSWARMIEADGPARLSNRVVRRYRQDHGPSVTQQMRRGRTHSRTLMQYHWAIVRRFGRKLGVRAASVRLTKVLAYGLLTNLPGGERRQPRVGVEG